jgi:two-component system chemotaxis response regulator CheY
MAYRIMIVDDSPVMRVFIRRVIQASGVEVSSYIEASNGRDALDKLSVEKADVILTDINMPVMDGEELLRCLHADKDLCSIPAIVVSTDASDCRMDRMQALGARGYLGKPFRPEDLRNAIEEGMGVHA